MIHKIRLFIRPISVVKRLSAVEKVRLKISAVVAQLVEQLHGETQKSLAHRRSNFSVNPE